MISGSDDMRRKFGEIDPTRTMNISLFSVIEFCKSERPNEPMSMIDIGANRGVMSLYAVGKGFDIVAFEPVAAFYHLLKKKQRLLIIESLIHLNNGRFMPYNYAVGDRLGHSTLYMHDRRPGGHSILKGKVLCTGSSTEFGTSVSLMTIDNFMEKSYPFEKQSIDLIKIDVEGAEHLVLEGAWKTIEKCKPLVFSECRGRQSGAITANDSWHLSC